jgi:sec-independent protein translocase protein TatA
MVVLLVVLVIFGPKQLPKLGKMFGKTMKSFQEGMDEADGTEKADTTDAAAQPAEKASTEKAADDAEKNPAAHA